MEDFLVRHGLVPHFVAFFFIVVTLVLFLSSRERAGLIKKLQTEGVLVKGTILYTKPVYSQSKNLVYTKIQAVYVVNYVRYFFEKNIYADSKEIQSNPRPGDEIELYYLPAKPEDAVLKGETQQTNNWSFVLVFASAAYFFSLLFKLLRESSSLTSR